MANSYLNRTPSSTGNRRKFTFSFWIKKSKNGTSETIYNVRPDSNGANRLSFHSTDTFRIAFEPISKYIFTSRKFRDTSAWYHIVVAVDTEQGTAADRVKLYVNGVQEGNLIKGDGGAATYPDQNADLDINTQNVINIGRDLETSSNFLNGYISHFSFVDGQQLTPTTFGETDSTSGIWKFKSPSGVTWGTNGFHLKFENSGALGTDSSGNSNTFTVNGNLKQTLDTPSNVYCTINPLVRNQVTLTTNNLTVQSPSTNWMGIPASMGVTKGKWYWEYKLALGNSWSQCGVMSSKSAGGYSGIYSTYVGNNSGGVALNSGNGDIYQDGSSGTTWFSGGLAEYDIIGVALDADNNKCYWSKNGTWGNSSNPATGTNGQTLDSNFTDHKPYFPAFSVHNCIITINFGNGYLGASAISSAGSNGNGSLFEYDVPSGYYALNTKNINTYG